MKRWFLGGRVYVSIARADPRTGSRVWYTRSSSKAGGRRIRTRHYQFLSLTRHVSSVGSFWKVIIGPVAIMYRMRPNKGSR